MSNGYFKPWISDEEPKLPEGWGLDAYRGRVPLTCDHCGIPLVLRDEYVYQFGPVETTTIYHNTEECAYSESI